MLPALAAAIALVLASQMVERKVEHARFASSLDVLGDVDGDGTSDLVVKSSEGAVAWIVSGAEPRVLLAVALPGENIGRPLVQRAGDVDGDGLADLVIAGRDRDAVTIVSGRTGVRLEELAGSVVLPLGDVDADGLPELCVLSRQDLRLRSSRSKKHLWSVATPSPAGRISLEPSGDVDHDGHTDILVIAESRVRVRSGRDGTVLFERGLIERFPPSRAIAPGDLDADGSVDILVSYPEHSCGPPANSRLRVYSPRTSAELFVLTSSQAGGGAEVLGDDLAALGNVDGDGVADFAVASHGWLHDEVTVVSGRTRVPLQQFLPEDLGADCHRWYVIRSFPDVDGDHVSELVIGASPYPNAGHCSEGYVQVRSGRTGRLLRRFDERELRSWGVPPLNSTAPAPR